MKLFVKVQQNPIILYFSASIISFLLIFSRRPDAILNPQFWAEDGKVWYADAYHHGLIYSLTSPVAGYYQTISRLVAVFAQIFPFAYAPLIFNLAAILIKIVVVNFILSSRLSASVPNFSLRVLLAFLYLALPHSHETNANLTNAQWHLALLSFLIIVAAPSEKIWWKIFDGTMLLISALSGPFCLLLLPIAAVKFFVKREKWTFLLLTILTVGSLLQISSIMTTERPSSQPLGATVELFLKIVGGHWFVATVVGEKIYYRMINWSLWNADSAFFISLAGFAALLYAFAKSTLELRLFIIFSSMICGGALISPAVSSEVPQWTLMWLSGYGSRYWLIPSFCFLTTLVYLAVKADLVPVRYISIGILVLSVGGIAADWKYPRFKNLEFQRYAAEFENAPVGQEVAIPLNPDPWDMRLIKK